MAGHEIHMNSWTVVVVKKALLSSVIEFNNSYFEAGTQV